MKYKGLAIFFVVVGSLGILFMFFNNSITINTPIASSDSTEYMKNYNVYALDLPEQVDFAGEEAPLSRWYVKEALDRELLVNTYWQSNMLLLLKRANRFLPIIEPILSEEGVPNDLKYIAIIESGLIPTIISPVGAAGIWQFMRGTGREYGLVVNGEVDERYHIEKATHAACVYLKEAKDKLGSWTLAAAAYNAGLNGVQKQLVRQEASNYYDLLLNPETGRYVYRILAIKTIMSNPAKYGFKFHQRDLYNRILAKEIAINTAVESWALWAKQQGVNYKVLKELNPWLRDSFLKNKNKRTYYIKVPEQGWAEFEYE